MSTAILSAPTLKVVLYEGAGADPLPDSDRANLLLTLLQKGYAVTCTRAGGALSAITQGVMLVLGKFLDQKPPQANDDTGNVTIHFRNIEDAAPDKVLALIDSVRGETNVPRPGGWKPWFPVIDYNRCTNCMQCLSFCLFDVYGVDKDHKIQVQNNSNCKTDCPACSRVCPEVAILFPKYKAGPINGDVVNSDDVRREAMKVDISALLGGDIYAALRDRSEKAKSRFSKERDSERALKERTRCLTKLAENMEIPMEVLSALPSLDQIQAKAEAAKAKAAAALEGAKQ